jgi:putative aldouronate transport system substrate-binding protein
MKGKRIIALVLGAIITAGLFAGCQKAKPTQTTSSKLDGVKGDPITFTFFNGFLNTLQFPDDNDFYKWVKEQTGVTIKVEYAVGDLKTKVGVMTASGDYPDFIEGNEEHQKFIDAGAAIPLNDLIEKYGENIKKTNGSMLKKLTQADGKIYFIAPYREGIDNSRVNRAFYVQRRVLEEAGYPKITSLDAYFKLLEDYKAKHPETDGNKTIGYSFISDQSSFWTLTNPATDLRGFTNDGVLQFDPKTITGKVYGNNEDSKTYWKYLNQQWNKGMIDPEAFTMSKDQYMAKLASGRVLGFYDQWWQFNDVQLSLAAAKKFDYQYVGLPIVFDNTVKERYQTPSVPIVRDGISISTKCKDPERAFKFLDWLLSEEVQKRANWGVKDQDYTVDANGKFVRTTEQRERLKSEEYRKKTGFGAFGYPWPINSINAKYADGNYWSPSGDPVEIAIGYTDADKKTLAGYGVKTYGEMFNQDKGNPWGEAWDVKLPDGSDIQITNTKLDDLSKKYVPKMIMAKAGEFDSLWNEYKAAYEKLDYKALEKFITEAIQKRAKEWN